MVVELLPGLVVEEVEAEEAEGVEGTHAFCPFYPASTWPGQELGEPQPLAAAAVAGGPLWVAPVVEARALATCAS